MSAKQIIKTLNEFRINFTQAISSMKDSYVIVMTTDAFGIQRVTEELPDIPELYDKGLEIHIFNEAGEIKWFRGSIDKEWNCRTIIDGSDLDRMFYWDEEQYIDIDTVASKNEEQIAYATGGGKFPLPISNYDDAKIQIRNYLEYEENTGQLYVADWRPVCFIERGGGSHGKTQICEI